MVAVVSGCVHCRFCILPCGGHIDACSTYVSAAYSRSRKPLPSCAQHFWSLLNLTRWRGTCLCRFLEDVFCTSEALALVLRSL